MDSFYSKEELLKIGFKTIGDNVLISRKASIYAPNKISVGHNVRIDDFCIISGNITIGSHVHISAYVALYGADGIEFEDYTGISARSTIYSAMDDFSGNYLIGPINPEETTHVTGGKVTVKKLTQIGSNVLIFPNLTIGEGCVVGACSMVRKSLDSWGVYYGIPAKKKKDRSRGMLEFV